MNTLRFISRILSCILLIVVYSFLLEQQGANAQVNNIGYTVLQDCDSVLIYCSSNQTSLCGFASTKSNGVRKAIIGTADGANSDFTFPSPFANSYRTSKQQYLYKASELINAGLVAGRIVGLGFQLADTAGLQLQYNFYNIKIGCTQMDSIEYIATSGLTQVYGPASIFPALSDSIYFGIGVGNYYYNWDGVSNILVEICYSNLTSEPTFNAHFKLQNTTYTSSNVSFSNSMAYCLYTGAPDITFYKRPVIQFYQNDDAINGFWLNGNSVADSTKSITTASASNQPFIWQTNDFNGVFLSYDTLTIPQNSMSIQPISPICKGDSVELKALFSSMCPVYQGSPSFTWLDAQSSIVGNDSVLNLSPTSTQTFYCHFQNGCGCTLIDSITVFVTEVEIQATIIATPSCGLNNGAFQLSGNGGSGNYQFSIDSGLTYSPQSLYIQQYQGFFWVSIEDASGCKSPQPIAFALNNSLSFDSINVQNVACYGGNSGQIELYLTGGNANNFFFLNNQYANIVGVFSSLSAEYYVVGVETFIGCKFDTLIRITQPDSNSIEVKTTDNSCIGSCNGKIAIQSISGGTAPFQLIWNSGSVSDSITSLCDGNYTLQLTDANGCIKNYSYVIATINPFTLSTIYAGTNNSVLLVPIGGVEPITFQWSNGNTSELLVATSDGIYTVLATDSSGCVVADTFLLIPNSVENISLDNFKLFPNPTSNFVTISAGYLSSVYSIQIYSMSGQLVFKKQKVTGDVTISLENWPQGIYFVRIFNDFHEIKQFKLIRTSEK